MPTQFHIDTAQPEEGVVVASPIGEVDLASSPILRNRLGEIISEAPKRFVIDLSGVPYMDSSGVATLVEALQQSRRQSTKLFLACLQDRVKSMFEIARLDTVFDIKADVESACGD